MIDTEANALLHDMLGTTAEFRDGQLEAIRALVGDRRRLLLVQRTGWGKSIVYFIAGRLLRDRGAGPTMIISPLLSLMRNQLAMAARVGILARTINSSNGPEWDVVEQDLAADECDALLISPERLRNDRFRTRMLPLMAKGIGLLVIDEAHCISDWGHDFRPDYRRIVSIVRALPRNIPILATTATANDRVVADVAEQLGDSLQIIRGPLARRSLRLQNVVLLNPCERLAWLAENVPKLPGSGIIYCLTVKDSYRVAAWLQSRGIDVQAYNADLPTEEREKLESDLLANRIKGLAATVALGMGFDKPDLGFVIHYQRPGSPVAYYQQIGRAGRALDDAYVVLLSGQEDDQIQDYFLRTAFPEPDDTRLILGALEKVEAMSIGDLQAGVNLSYGKIDQALRHLEVEGIVGRLGTQYYRTPNPWKPDTERMERVRTTRIDELAQMREYVTHTGCLMEFIARELDDPHAHPCGRCASCTDDFLPTAPDETLQSEALVFLHSENLIVEPRGRWPKGPAPGSQNSAIPVELRCALGRALCLYGDPGWGRMVAEGKYLHGRFCDELVAASAELVQIRWRPDPFPAWVTCIPSKRHPDLVPDFAGRLAAALGLPFKQVFNRIDDSREQKEMQNSAQQASNVRASLRIAGKCDDVPVLLVDDIVDSRWTLTVAGMYLRRVGASTVYPFALALASGRSP